MPPLQSRFSSYVLHLLNVRTSGLKSALFHRCGQAEPEHVVIFNQQHGLRLIIQFHGVLLCMRIAQENNLDVYRFNNSSRSKSQI